jgi:predicted ATPase
MFPKGNGELAKMDKKTYKPTSEVEEYIENFSSAGLENLVFDEIHPNEEKMDEYMEGSSKAGNNPKWANAVETDINKRRNKVRKRNLLGVLKKKESYDRQPQPVYDSNKDSEEEKDVARIFQALESTDDKKEKLIKEEIDKMNRILGYNKKTQ